MLLVVALGLIVPTTLARIFGAWAGRIGAAALAASLIPGSVMLWGTAERWGFIATHGLISAGTDFARAEQWAYLAGGCAFLFLLGLVAAFLSLALKRPAA